MPAWDVRRKWMEHDKTKYGEFVVRQATNFVNKGTKFTCEDLALRILIDFAADRYLPITIVNGTYTKGMRPEDWSSFRSFRTAVLKRTGARDLHKDKNTTLVGTTAVGDLNNLARAEPGDLIYLDYGAYKHIQVVVEKSKVAAKSALGSKIKIAQGNFRSDQCTVMRVVSDRNEPGTYCYLGKKVESYEYNQDGKYKSNQTVFQDHDGRIRRWNFAEWNKKRAAPKKVKPYWDDKGR